MMNNVEKNKSVEPAAQNIDLAKNDNNLPVNRYLDENSNYQAVVVRSVFAYVAYRGDNATPSFGTYTASNNDQYNDGGITYIAENGQIEGFLDDNSFVTVSDLSSKNDSVNDSKLS